MVGHTSEGDANVLTPRYYSVLRNTPESTRPVRIPHDGVPYDTYQALPLPELFTTLHVCEHIFYPFLFAKNARLLNLSFVVQEYAMSVPCLMSLARLCSIYCPFSRRLDYGCGGSSEDPYYISRSERVQRWGD